MAIYVITGEDIQRSGATSIPEVLRLAPGVEVARIEGSKWSVGIRGFGTRLSRSVLVLIDGRTVYTTFFAGTYWEVQDTLLEDIERIEVIRGVRRFQVRAAALVQLRSIGLHPAPDAAGVDEQPSFRQHFGDVQVRERVPQTPAHRQQDHLTRVVAAFERIGRGDRYGLPTLPERTRRTSQRNRESSGLP